ncbi:hypothetical protein SVIOM342S_09562 [Streptomyces violaceorubidus]
MLVAAAVCPCPPLLVPEVAAGAAPELDTARAACTDALGVLAASRPDRLVVVGPADSAGPEVYPQGARGSFRGFGVDLDVYLGADIGDADGPQLPYGLAVGAWLLGRTGWTGVPVEGIGVGDALSAERCAALGGDIAGRAGRTALLVLGDASACRTLKAPGYLDEPGGALRRGGGPCPGCGGRGRTRRAGRRTGPRTQGLRPGTVAGPRGRVPRHGPRRRTAVRGRALRGRYVTATWS